MSSRCGSKPEAISPRRGRFKLCQWNVCDPLPQIAPLMPAERPADAPPREAEVAKDGKGEGRKE
jgi:hypothetical protein